MDICAGEAEFEPERIALALSRDSPDHPGKPKLALALASALAFLTTAMLATSHEQVSFD